MHFSITDTWRCDEANVPGGTMEHDSARTTGGNAERVHRPQEAVTITVWHFYKNAAGFFGFVSLFVYCGILLARGTASGATMFIACGMFATFVTSVRSGKRLLLLWRMRRAQIR
ncbi:hypothetical protein L3067_11710 [Xanthomonas sp. PPL568]|uniref:hypothetical protein n=1 Tax=Xanthomonas indica TaxID=2912242 RepID=UPI001F5841F3|nr:hypothetical protein [Xanthomonas indica]MCI2245267.1 hypothetical protein [Xanthomonas indica]